MRMNLMGWTAAAILLTAGAASAETLHFAATLKGADEVPANATKGTGKVAASLDTTTKKFTYKVTYSGLTGPATMAHFHGPAAPGANAGPVVPVPKDALASPMKGAATLDDAQIADLKAGRWYFNIHTAANPGGEIRGQLAAGK
ncbi:MAG TPA: CHRD domain-containing protein [Caulobacteraceae bacterium]|nr:CHRD domain-containing protein [Caulobacteraceae bacterium]